MAKRYKLEIKEEKINNVVSAILEITNKYEEDKQLLGSITCPECGGELCYTIASSNKHIWGTCKTKNCLSWVM